MQHLEMMNRSRYKDIQKKIDKFRDKKPISRKPACGSAAFNIAVELLASAIVGIIIGMFFDNLFDSKPISFIICIILAMVASFRSIWKKNIK